MSSLVSWKFSRLNRGTVERLLPSSPYYQKTEYPYYLFFVAAENLTDPSVVVEVRGNEIEFCYFSDPQVLAAIMDYLGPQLEELYGAYEEVY